MNKIIRKIFWKLKTISFIRAFLVLVQGSIIAQIINFAFHPLLTRLYTPYEFGLYALFLSGVGLLGAVTTMRFDLSIITAEDESDAKRLFYLCLSIVTGLSLFIAMLLLFFKDTLIDLLNLSSTSNWIYLLPVALLLNGTYSTLINYNYRLKMYKDISKSTVTRVIALVGFQIIFYYVGFGFWGLIIGYIVSLLFGINKLFVNIIIYIKPENDINLKNVSNMIKKYKDYPLYQLPTSFVNHFTYESITYSIAAIFSKSALGLYALTNRILSLPISVISESARQLFIKQLMENKQDIPKMRKLIIYISCFLFFVITIPFGVLSLFGNQIFGFFFGAEWAKAGDYIRPMILLYIIRFVVYPISGITLVFNKQKVSLYYQLILIMCVFIAATLAKVYNLGITNYLFIQSLMMSVTYIALWISCYRMCVKKV